MSRNKANGMDRGGQGIQGDYSLVDFAMGKLSSEQSLEVLRELETSDEKSKELEIILEILDTKDPHRRPQRDEDRPSRSANRLLRERIPIFAITMRSAAVVFLAIGIAFIAREVSKPMSLDLVKVCVDDMDVRTRSGNSRIAGIAYGLLLDGRNERAMELLDWCVKAFPDGEEGAHAHLLRGGTLLMQADRYRMGFFSHFDTVLVMKGLDELRLVAHLSSRRHIQECALFLEIKGNLMIGNQERAVEHLGKLERMGGIRNLEARKLRQFVTR